MEKAEKAMKEGPREPGGYLEAKARLELLRLKGEAV